jgi:hypothetical protein
MSSLRFTTTEFDCRKLACIEHLAYSLNLSIPDFSVLGFLKEEMSNYSFSRIDHPVSRTANLGDEMTF